jgi:DNA-binding NarL/FixJ family response regulator
MGASVAASVAVISEMVAQTARLAEELSSGFEQHPGAEVVRSLPGLGTILSARVLGEFGDEPDRYATAKCRKNYAGTSPITRASGTKKAVLARHVRNRRLADAIHLWAFASLNASTGARAYYDARRAAGDGHHQALRALGNRLVGILHGCLAHHVQYDEITAWAHRPENNLLAAAWQDAPVGCLEPLGLSQREAQVVHLVTAGLPNSVIAEQLHLSTGRVRKHLDNVYNKLGVRGRSPLTAFVLNIGGR